MRAGQECGNADETGETNENMSEPKEKENNETTLLSNEIDTNQDEGIGMETEPSEPQKDNEKNEVVADDKSRESEGVSEEAMDTQAEEPQESRKSDDSEDKTLDRVEEQETDDHDKTGHGTKKDIESKEEGEITDKEAVNTEMEDVVVSSSFRSSFGWDAVRDVYKRACIVHCPRKAVIRLKWAQFEENVGNVEEARNILVQLVTKYPMLLEARMQQIDLERRDTREGGQNYKAKALTEELVAVQRLAILVPAKSPA